MRQVCKEVCPLIQRGKSSNKILLEKEKTNILGKKYKKERNKQRIYAFYPFTGRLEAKKDFIRAAHSSANMPLTTSVLTCKAWGA